MDIQRRISATFKDLPGGQVLGPTFDYTHRLLDPPSEGPSPEPRPRRRRQRRCRASPISLAATT